MYNDRDRFDTFTERARKVLSLAQEEAQRFNHNYIGTEHLLLGLVREGDGVAAKVLTNLGVNLEKVRMQTIQVLSQSAGTHSEPPHQGQQQERLQRMAYRCSFCGKSQDQTKRLIAGPGGVYICDECVDLCREIIEEEQTTATASRSSEWRMSTRVDARMDDLDRRRAAVTLYAKHLETLPADDPRRQRWEQEAALRREILARSVRYSDDLTSLYERENALVAGAADDEERQFLRDYTLSRQFL